MHVNTVHMFSIIIVRFRCICHLWDLDSLLNTTLYVYLLIVLFIYNPEFITKVWLIFSSFIQTKKQLVKLWAEEGFFQYREKLACLIWSIWTCHSDCCLWTWAERIWRMDKKWKILNYFDLFVIFRMQHYGPLSRSTHRTSCCKALPE